MIITSKSNSLMKEIASLKEKKYRKLQNAYIVEGIKMVNEAISNHLNIKYIVGLTENLADISSDKNYEIIEVSKEVFAYISDSVTPQGILAVINMPENIKFNPSKNCLILDRIADPGNMGTIIRTAVASNYNEIYLIDSVDPYNPKTVRSSMSGIYFVKIYSGTTSEILELLGDYKILVADMDGANIFTYTPPEKFCLVIGNEANGVSEEILNQSYEKIKIPMESQTESLNASVSAGILMYNLKYNKK